LIVTSAFAVEILSAKIYFRKTVESIKQQFKSVREKTFYNIRLQIFKYFENFSAFIKDANAFYGADFS
jgi:hypothetical protein